MASPAIPPPATRTRPFTRAILRTRRRDHQRVCPTGRPLGHRPEADQAGEPLAVIPTTGGNEVTGTKGYGGDPVEPQDAERTRAAPVIVLGRTLCPYPDVPAA